MYSMTTSPQVNLPHWSHTFLKKICSCAPICMSSGDECRRAASGERHSKPALHSVRRRITSDVSVERWVISVLFFFSPAAMCDRIHTREEKRHHGLWFRLADDNKTWTCGGTGADSLPVFVVMWRSLKSLTVNGD